MAVALQSTEGEVWTNADWNQLRP